jgi:transcription initiation factor TFIIB
MGRIEDPPFHDRIILDKDIQKEIFREYTDFFGKGSAIAAAEKLNLKESTFHAYLKYQNKSVPTKIFYEVAKSLGLNPKKFIKKRTTLKKIRARWLNNFRENNKEDALQVARKAGPLGIKTLEKKTGKNRKEIMKEVRQALFDKYLNENPYKVIGNLSVEKAREEYGEDWLIKKIEPMFRGLERKHGKSYQYVLDDLKQKRKALQQEYKGFDEGNGKEIETTGEKCVRTENLIWDYNNGEIIDVTTGKVVSRIIDQGPEWRAFDLEQHENRSRVGPPSTPTIHDKGLGTIIDWRDEDVYGKRLGPKQKAQNYRLRKWQRRSRISDGTQRNIAIALSEINKIADSLTLPKNILETASTIYKKAAKQRLMRGRSVQGITAAAIYVACRQCGVTRSLEDIAQASNVNKKDVGRSYRFLVKELDYSIPSVESSQYITKFSNQLLMNGRSEEIAHKIFAAAKEDRLTSGRGPTGIAAAASYIASVLAGERKTQREIAEIAQVTEVTIRNRYKEMVERLQFIIEL